MRPIAAIARSASGSSQLIGLQGKPDVSLCSKVCSMIFFYTENLKVRRTFTANLELNVVDNTVIVPFVGLLANPHETFGLKIDLFIRILLLSRLVRPNISQLYQKLRRT